MKTVVPRFLSIFGIASTAACVFAYAAATEGPQHFYTVVYWLATVLLLVGCVWAFVPVSRYSVTARVGSLLAAALSFLFIWGVSSQLIVQIMLRLHSAHAP